MARQVVVPDWGWEAVGNGGGRSGDWPVPLTEALFVAAERGAVKLLRVGRRSRDWAIRATSTTCPRRHPGQIPILARSTSWLRRDPDPVDTLDTAMPLGRRIPFQRTTASPSNRTPHALPTDRRIPFQPTAATVCSLHRMALRSAPHGLAACTASRSRSSRF